MDLKDIKQFPNTAFIIESQFGNLSLSCEYSSHVPRPEFKPQDFGSRPRLISQENETIVNFYESEDTEPDSDHRNDDSLPLVFLTTFELSKNQDFSQKSVITSKCANYEHERIGFTPLSHTICSDSALSASEEEFGFEGYNWEINKNLFKENAEGISEDIKAAIYKGYCDKANNIKLFNFREGKASLSDQLQELHTRMRGLRETRLKLS